VSDVIERIVSHSEIETARMCLHKHDLAYRQRWTSPPSLDGGFGPLDIGKVWHQVMDQHYRKKAGDHEAFPLATIDDIRNAELRELIEWMYDRYIQVYGDDPRWKVLGTEHETLIPLPDLYPGVRYILKAKVDLFVMDGRRLWVVDHLASQNLPTEFVADWVKVEQLGLYAWAANKMGKAKVFGMIANVARYQRNKTYMELSTSFYRHPSIRTDAELERVAQDAVKTMHVAWDIFKQGESPRSPSDRCASRCQFKQTCPLGRRIGWQQEIGLLQAKGFVIDHTRH
jgi:hypothetical protein